MDQILRKTKFHVWKGLSLPFITPSAISLAFKQSKIIFMSKFIGPFIKKAVATPYEIICFAEIRKLICETVKYLSS